MTKSKGAKPKRKLSKLDKFYTEERVARILEEIDKAHDEGRFVRIYPQKGRPSLTGERVESPTVGFRLTPELRQRAREVAEREGLTLSALARRALEAYLASAG